MAHAVTVIAPSQVAGTGDQGPFPFDLFEARCLAQGDSWFSIGSIPPGVTSNVLDELVLTRSVVVVNCANPGRELKHMADTTRDAMLLRLLAGRLALKWDAILLSGGGNDLIDAARVGPDAPPDMRLLARPDERGNGPLQGDDYVSDPGWATFTTHLGAVFNAFVDRRDAGVNKGVPLVLHNYADLMPRPSPAGPRFGPWLQPALQAFAVPEADRPAVARALMQRLTLLLQTLIAARQATDPACALHLVDTRSAGLVLADATATGLSGDWANEIHPTREGYEKLGGPWRATLDALL